MKQAIRLRRAASVFPPLFGESRPFLFSLAFLFGGICKLPFTLSRRQSQHVPRCCEVAQTQCSRPSGTATCHLHTARGMPENLPFQRHDLLARVTYVLKLPSIQPGGHVQPGHALLDEDANSDRLGSAQILLVRIQASQVLRC